MVWKKYSILKSLLILVFFLTGCATPHPIDLSKNMVIPERESVVFGRINIFFKALFREKPVMGHSVYIYLLNNTTRKTIVYHLYGDGSFYWHLTPGEYAIANFEFQGSVGRIFAEFTVSEEKPIIYIGKLIITLNDLRYHMRVEDDYEQASLAFREKFPEIIGEVVKSLMQLEKPR